jgi:hypothetical protein
MTSTRIFPRQANENGVTVKELNREPASRRFIEFFTATIRNHKIRMRTRAR